MEKILMIGPARNVKGGMTTVVDNYYNYGLDKEVELKYIETINDSSKISKLFKEIKGMHEFKKNINKYDIVHIHMASRRSTFRKGKYLRIAKKHNKKVIIHIHGAEYKEFYNECNENKKKYVRETLALADCIIVLSEEWKEYFKNLVDEKKIIVMYNSILLPKDFKKNLDSCNILFLGRIGRRKGIYDLLDVLKQIICIHPEIKLYVGGDGEVDNLIKIIKTDNLEKNVEYIGWVKGEDKERLLKKCSFYILPSYNEGMPMSILEAMAYKNVTISTNVGGIPKVIINNENGIIINPGDKETLYKELLRLIENSDERVRLSFNARKTIENGFDIKSSIKKLVNLYRNLGGNK